MEFIFHLFAVSVLAIVLELTSGQVAPECQDVDTAACSTTLASTPTMCQDATLSASCQRFCGFCPALCYNCPDAVKSFNECSNTTTCAQDEICIVREHSEIDGAIEYVLGCEKRVTCDGLNLGFHSGIGKRESDDRNRRDLNFHCCDTNLCNVPSVFMVSTTTVPTTTVTTKPTSTLTPLHNCSRDIVFILDGSTSIGATNHSYLKSFVRAIISYLKIGAMDSLVAVVEYSDTARVEWYLDDYMTLLELQRAADNIPYVQGTTATHAAFWLARNSVLTSRHGARLNADDIVIFITDGGTDLPGMAINEARQLHDQGVEVIAVGVGTGPDDHELDQIKSNYFFKVASYRALKQILASVVTKLCV